MQDPSLHSQIKAHAQPPPQFPEEEHLKCPRCDSGNTKFCYYNNYNLSQPRHFCKNCKRYWTKGGTLRNIPVGGGSRKNTKRRPSSSSDPATAKRPAAAASTSLESNFKKNDCQTNNGETTETLLPLKEESRGGQFGNFLEVSGSFSSLLGPGEGQYGNLNGVIIGPNGSSFQKSADFDDSGTVQNGLQTCSGNINADGFFNIQGDGGDGGGATGWSGVNSSCPDLSIYTPSSSFP